MDQTTAGKLVAGSSSATKDQEPQGRVFVHLGNTNQHQGKVFTRLHSLVQYAADYV